MPSQEKWRTVSRDRTIVFQLSPRFHCFSPFFTLPLHNTFCCQILSGGFLFVCFFISQLSPPVAYSFYLPICFPVSKRLLSSVCSPHLCRLMFFTKGGKKSPCFVAFVGFPEGSKMLKRCLLLGRKVMTNLDSILKSRDITLPTKVHLVKAMAFPVVMCGCESWTIKKAERQRIDAFELWCWRRLLRVHWTARRSNQSIPKEISPEYSLEGLMLRLKLQYFGHLMRRTDSLEKTLMLGKIEGGRRRG